MAQISKGKCKVTIGLMQKNILEQEIACLAEEALNNQEVDSFSAYVSTFTKLLKSNKDWSVAYFEGVSTIGNKKE